MRRNAQTKINKKEKETHHTQNIENRIAIQRIPNVLQSRQWRRWTLSVRDLASRIHRQLVFLFSYIPVRLCCWPCVCVCVQWHRFSLNWQQVKHSSCFILFCCWLGFLFLFSVIIICLFSTRSLFFLRVVRLADLLTSPHPPTEMAEDTGNGGLDFPPCLFSLSFYFFYLSGRGECRRVVVLNPSCLCPCALLLSAYPLPNWHTSTVTFFSFFLHNPSAYMRVAFIPPAPYPIELIKKLLSITRQQFRLGEE